MRRAELEMVDESTAIRQLLALGVKDYAVQLCRMGKVTLTEAASLANITLREMIDILLDHGVKATYGQTDEGKP